MFLGTSSIWANSLGNIGQESRVPGSLLRSRLRPRLRSGVAPRQDRQAVVFPGSSALQLAADHPDRVSRLVVASMAYRPGPGGRRVQQHVADLAAGGQRRRALRAFAPIPAESPPGQPLRRRSYVARGPYCNGMRLGSLRACERPPACSYYRRCGASRPAGRSPVARGRSSTHPSANGLCPHPCVADLCRSVCPPR